LGRGPSASQAGQTEASVGMVWRSVIEVRPLVDGGRTARDCFPALIREWP